MKSRYWHGWLILTFCGVAVCFVAATLYSQARMAELDRTAMSISSTVAPSIQHLAAARAEVHLLHNSLGDYVNKSISGQRAQADSVVRSQQELDGEVRQYLRLPIGVPEKELWIEVDKSLRTLDAAVRQVLREVAQGQSQLAREAMDLEVRPAVEGARVALMQSIELNASEAQTLAVRIQSMRRRATAIAYVLNGLSIVVGGIAVSLVLAQVRRSTHLAHSLHEVTKRRADELELFAGRVAHDILGPLSPVNMFLSRLEGQISDTRLLPALERARRGLRRSTRIVQDLLNFAKAGARPTPGVSTPLRETLRELAAELEPTAKEAGAVLAVRGPADDGRIACSPGVFSSLVENLIRNALKYMADQPIREVSVSAFWRPESVRVEVRDTGPGLPPGTEEMVFEPFVRVDSEGEQPGIGLGLATVKRLAEAHGGAVGVHSSPGKGCLFWFELPKAESEPMAGDQPRSPATENVAPTARA